MSSDEGVSIIVFGVSPKTIIKVYPPDPSRFFTLNLFVDLAE